MILSLNDFFFQRKTDWSAVLSSLMRTSALLLWGVTQIPQSDTSAPLPDNHMCICHSVGLWGICEREVCVTGCRWLIGLILQMFVSYLAVKGVLEVVNLIKICTCYSQPQCFHTHAHAHTLTQIRFYYHANTRRSSKHAESACVPGGTVAQEVAGFSLFNTKKAEGWHWWHRYMVESGWHVYCMSHLTCWIISKITSPAPCNVGVRTIAVQTCI